MERLWPGVFVEEVNLAQNISAIRRALGGDGRHSFIQTVAGAGYRFVAPVRVTNHGAGLATDRLDSPERTSQTRLLVLPFRMLRPDPEIEFLAFSLPDALTATLSGLETVVIRSSLVAARFSGEPPDLARIAREAAVDLVISGTLVADAGHLRVTAQLSDAAAGTLVWSFTEQAPAGDLFRLQDSLVGRIAESLSVPLSERDRRQLRRDVPATPRAYEYYLRANEASRPDGQDAAMWTVARDLYRQSLEEDPRYAPAWTRLARVYRLLGKYRTDDSAANLARAEEALTRALALNPDLPAAHNLYAHIDVDRGRAADAMVRLLNRVRAGGDAEIFAGLVQACRFCGLLEASVAAHTQAHKRDATIATSIMHTYFVMGRYEEAIASHGPIKGYVYAMSLASLGRGDDALRLLAYAEGQPHRLSPALLGAARTFIEGRREESIAALDGVMAAPADAENLFYLARQYASLDAHTKALDALSRAIDGGYFCYESLAADPAFAGMRALAAFTPIVDRARAGHDAAQAAFQRADGARLLAV